MYKRKKMMDALLEMPDKQRQELAAEMHRKIIRQYTEGKPIVGMDLSRAFDDALPQPSNTLLKSQYVTIGATHSVQDELSYVDTVEVTWEPSENTNVEREAWSDEQIVGAA